MKGFIPLGRALCMLAPAMIALGACDRGITNPGDHEEFYTVQVIDRSQAERPVVATWVRGQGWTGQIPTIRLSNDPARVTLGFRVLSDDGDELRLDGSPYSVRFGLAQGAQTGIIATTPAQQGEIFHLDHVYLYGLAAGTVQIRFILWDRDHADDSTDPIGVTVAP